MGARKPKDLNRTDRIGQGDICQREIDLSFNKSHY